MRSPANIGRKKGVRQESIGGSRAGQTTKIHLSPNSIRLSIAVTLSSGESSDNKGYEPLMLEPQLEYKVFIAELGYASDAIREDLIARQVVPVISMRQNRKKQDPINGAKYAHRDLIECGFNKVKHSHRLATRYVETTEIDLGFVLITSAHLWRRHFLNNT